MEKQDYEKIKEIKERISKGTKTNFHERNAVNIYDKRMRTKKRLELQAAKNVSNRK